MSETTPENPPTDEDTPTPTTDEGGDEGTPTPPDDDTPPDTGTGGGDEGGGTPLPPPPVVLPGSDYQQGVDALYGELTDEVNAPRWAQALEELTYLVGTTYEEDVLSVAYDLAGSEAERRAMARDAAASLLTARITQALQGAQAEAQAADQPPAPEPPAEG